MIRSIIDLLKIEASYREYLISRGVTFDQKGFPVFQPSMYADDWPSTIVTYPCRNNTALVKDPSSTAISFYLSDERIYPRLEKVFKDINEYKRFMAVISIDLTITDDMDTELQLLLLMVNQLFTMILAVNNVKIIHNTRSGGLSNSTVFRNVPKGITVASGFLGCDRVSEENMSYISKILYLQAGKILIYGKHDINAEKQLDLLGFDYRLYPDVHQLTKMKEAQNGRQ